MTPVFRRARVPIKLACVSVGPRMFRASATQATTKLTKKRFFTRRIKEDPKNHVICLDFTTYVYLLN